MIMENNKKTLTKEEQIELGEKLLKLNGEATIIDLSKKDSNIDVVYICEPVKGGSSIIVGSDGTVLYANFLVDHDVHLAEFKKGRRTNIKDFENI